VTADKAPRAAGRWRERLPFAVAAALLAAGIVALAAAELWRSRQAALGDGARRAEGLAHVLAEQTLRSMLAVDLTLQGIEQALGLTPGRRKHSPALEEAMRARLPSLPYVRALFVIGADGYLTQDTDVGTPDVSLADRPYFQAHRRDPRLGLHVGTPLVSRSTGTWFLSMSRRVSGPDGSFGGVVAAAVEVRSLTRFYSGIDVGPGGALALFLGDGTLVARIPDSEGVGRFLTESEAFRRGRGGPNATSRGVSPLDGEARVVSFRPVAGLPLVVMVGLSERALLAEWRSRAIALVGTAGVLLLLVGATAALLVERRRRRREAAARLARAERLETLGQLTGGVAHDFGNLLTVVGGNLAMIRQSTGNADCVQQAEIAERAVQRGTRLIRQLLAFARRQDLRPETVCPNDLVRAFEPLLRQAAGRHAVLETRLDPALPCCRLDPGQLEAALLNLVVNARDATPAGGRITLVTERVQVGGPAPAAGGALHPGVYVRVAVRDTGAGMPPAVLERAFEPFFTTKSEGQGTGLGLSQVYGFVKQSGGHLSIDSTPGAGTAVSLYFPEERGEAADRPRPDAADAAA
jgi:signal transduction histidine kinase